MRSFLTFALSGVLAVVIQSIVGAMLVSRVTFIPVAPDLVTVLCVYLGLHYDSPGGAIGAFLLGYLLDAFSGAPPGLYALTMTSVFTVVYLVSKHLWTENPVTNLAAVGVGCGTKSAVVILYFLLMSAPGPWAVLLRNLALEGLLALVLSPLIFSALDAYLRSTRAKGWHAAE